MQRMIETYNDQVFKWERGGNQNANVDDFVVSDDEKISWSSTLKQKLKGKQITEFSDAKFGSPSIARLRNRTFTLTG